jgi:hypothetical protein
MAITHPLDASVLTRANEIPERLDLLWTNCERPPARDRIPSRFCIREEAAATR